MGPDFALKPGISQFVKGSDIQLSPHFHLREFDCHCTRPGCTITYVDPELIYYLEKKRSRWAEPIAIVSGFRCTDHNREVGGKPGSFHLTGKAADIRVEGVKPSEVADECEDAGGLGRYPTFTHVDLRGYRARWWG